MYNYILVNNSILVVEVQISFLHSLTATAVNIVYIFTKLSRSQFVFQLCCDLNCFLQQNNLPDDCLLCCLFVIHSVDVIHVTFGRFIVS